MPARSLSFPCQILSWMRLIQCKRKRQDRPGAFEYDLLSHRFAYEKSCNLVVGTAKLIFVD